MNCKSDIILTKKFPGTYVKPYLYTLKSGSIHKLEFIFINFEVTELYKIMVNFHCFVYLFLTNYVLKCVLFGFVDR